MPPGNLRSRVRHAERGLGLWQVRSLPLRGAIGRSPPMPRFHDNIIMQFDPELSINNAVMAIDERRCELPIIRLDMRV